MMESRGVFGFVSIYPLNMEVDGMDSELLGTQHTSIGSRYPCTIRYVQYQCHGIE